MPIDRCSLPAICSQFAVNRHQLDDLLPNCSNFALLPDLLLHLNHMAVHIANLLGHVSGQKPSGSARSYEAGLVVVRRRSDIILPDTCPKTFAMRSL